MGEWINAEKQSLDSYHPEVGEVLKSFFSMVEEKASLLPFKNLPKSMVDFIGEGEWIEKWEEISSNTKSKEAFIQRFYAWFNLFMCFKFVHYYRDNYQKNIPVNEAAKILYNKVNSTLDEAITDIELLNKFREWQSAGSFGVFF
jgi:hypothetical protein